MNQYGGTLPVYSGTRYQRGGGLLDSILHIAKPIAKKVLLEVAKAAPRIAGNIISKKQRPGAAVLGGLKTVGLKTLLGVTGRRAPKRKAIAGGASSKRVNKRRKVTAVRRKPVQKDFFT